MNYIKEINGFYDQLEFNPLSGAAVTLWHALIHVNNKAKWRKEFTAPAQVLCMKSGLKNTAFKNARKELQDKGYISYTLRPGGQAPSYQLHSMDQMAEVDEVKQKVDEEPDDQTLVPTTDHSLDDIPVSLATHNLDHNLDHKPDHKPDRNSDRIPAPLVKRNETKRNNDDGDTREENPHTFYEQNLGILTPFISESISQWCEELSDELVVASMKRAVHQNKHLFSYCEAILKRWKHHRVRTLSQAEALDSDFKPNRSTSPPSKPGKADTANQSILEKLKKEGDT